MQNNFLYDSKILVYFSQKLMNAKIIMEDVLILAPTQMAATLALVLLRLLYFWINGHVQVRLFLLFLRSSEKNKKA